jgi:radical SAM protein (TIGR01212 family)
MMKDDNPAKGRAQASPLPSRLNRQANALRGRYGERVWRIGLDGGFSCPNRSSGRGSGGCSYCAPAAARASYLAEGEASIEEQVEAGIDFLEMRYGARLFFPYFQAYSSTNASVAVLRRSYDRALEAARGAVALRGGAVCGLVVSTRPDCLDEEKAELLASYAEQGLEVWVELGLQSAHDATLRRIARGHDYAAFVRGRELLRKHSLRTAVHLILGLPGEVRIDMLETVRRVTELGVDGVKFHDLLLPKGSALASEYLKGELTLLHYSRLPSLLADCLELLDPRCEVIRLCSDADESDLVVPRFKPDKAIVYREVETELARRGSRQGFRYMA